MTTATVQMTQQEAWAKLSELIRAHCTDDELCKYSRHTTRIGESPRVHAWVLQQDEGPGILRTLAVGLEAERGAIRKVLTDLADQAVDRLLMLGSK